MGHVAAFGASDVKSLRAVEERGQQLGVVSGAQLRLELVGQYLSEKKRKRYVWVARCPRLS